MGRRESSMRFRERAPEPERTLLASLWALIINLSSQGHLLLTRCTNKPRTESRYWANQMTFALWKTMDRRTKDFFLNAAI